MNTILKFAFAFTIAVSSIWSQAPVYTFDAKRVPVGTVYHYIKTNIDGSQPESISTFVASVNRIESFKYHEKGTRAGLVVAEMDWRNFIARRLESWQIFSNEERRLAATLIFDEPEMSVEVFLPAVKNEPETVKIGRLPFHLYNFDLASLNVTWRHLADPKKKFSVGIADPTFKSDPLFAYKGELTVAYERDERRNGVETRRYNAAGSGIGGLGTIWVNKREGHIEDMEFDVPNNPEWKSFKLKLSNTERMSPTEWQAFIASRF